MTETNADVHLLGIAGSLRAASFNRRLLEAATQLDMPAGTTIEIDENLADIPPFNTDLEASPPPAVTRLRSAVAAANGLLIATPEYNRAVPGVLKNAIDWLSRSSPGEGISGKPVAVIGATAGPWGTRLAQEQLRALLTACGAFALPAPTLYVANARSAFDETGLLVDQEIRENLAKVVTALREWVRRLSPA